MLDFLKFRSVQDQSPGSLIYVGVSRDFTPSLCHCSYSASEFEEACLDDDSPKPVSRPGLTDYVYLVGVHDPDYVKAVGKWFDIHPLILEDVMNTGQRPKIEETDNGLFLALKNVEVDKETGAVCLQHLSILHEGDRVVSFQEAESGPWTGVLERIRKGKGRIRGAGGAYLTLALIDAVVDRCYSALGMLSYKAEEMEEEMEVRQSEELLLALYRLRREVILLRNVFVPTRGILEEFATLEDVGITDELAPFLHDVRDHARQVTESADALHDILTSMLDLQISLAGMRMNSVMKMLTLVATIFIPLTFLAGIYGMNFEFMPELRWKYGYPFLLGAMAVGVLIMIIVFKRKRWL